MSPENINHFFELFRLIAFQKTKKMKSAKYKYIFGPTEVGGKLKIYKIPTHICLLRHTRRIPGPYCKILVQITKKNLKHFV